MSTTSLPRIAVGAALVAALLATGDPVSAGYPGANGRLAFALNVGGNVDVYSSTPDGNGLRRLTDSPAFEACAAYSPDGMLIAYCSEESGLVEIWTMTKNGKDRRQLTHLNGRMTFPDFSPDARHVAFSGRLTLDQPTSDVYAVDANGENLAVLTTDPADDSFPAYSPDGSTIVFLSSRSGINQVWLMDTDGGNQRQLTFDAAVKGQLPEWSPDGTHIAYVAHIDFTGGQIWVMDADGANQHLLVDLPGNLFGPAWSPDGTQIAFASGLPNRGQYVMNADGSDIHQVVDGTPFAPSWQPHVD